MKWMIWVIVPNGQPGGVLVQLTNACKQQE
jgi:hypothetical protein